MGSSSPTRRSSPLPERCLRPGRVLTPPTRSHLGLAPASELLLHSVSLRLRCHTLPPARLRSPATGRLSLWNRRGLPYPPLAEKNPVPSSAVRSTPRYRPGRRVAGLRHPACLLPKPLVVPSVPSQREGRRRNTSSNGDSLRRVYARAQCPRQPRPHSAC